MLIQSILSDSSIAIESIKINLFPLKERLIPKAAMKWFVDKHCTRDQRDCIIIFFLRLPGFNYKRKLFFLFQLLGFKVVVLILSFSFATLVLKPRFNLRNMGNKRWSIFRLRAQGRLDDFFISLLKKSRKSFPFKTGWKSNERAIVLHQQIDKP